MKYLRDSDSDVITILPRSSFYINALRLPVSAHDPHGKNAHLNSRPEPFKSTVPEDLKHQIDRNPHPKSHPSLPMGNNPSKAVSAVARDPNGLWQCTNSSYYRVKISNIIYRTYFDITGTIIVAYD
jgi:hypothetical protein